MCNFSHDQIEKTWITCPLAEIYKIIGGGTPSTKVQEYWEGIQLSGLKIDSLLSSTN
jgi:hypothetical protein